MKKLTKICTKCFHDPCKCLNTEGWGDTKTRILIRKDVFQTKKALRVYLKKQTLKNGVEIPSGIELWIPGGSINSIMYDSSYFVPNWKLNEVIRTIGIDKIKNK